MPDGVVWSCASSSAAGRLQNAGESFFIGSIFLEMLNDETRTSSLLFAGKNLRCQGLLFLYIFLSGGGIKWIPNFLSLGCAVMWNQIWEIQMPACSLPEPFVQ